MVAKSRSSLFHLAVALVAFLSVTCAPTDDKSKSIEPSKDDVKPPKTKDSTPTKHKELASLCKRIDAALDHIARRELHHHHGFWTIFHGILGMGLHQTMMIDQERNRVNAMDHICAGKPIPGLIFVKNVYGAERGLEIKTVPGDIGRFESQGHQDQFVAEMAQWGMPRERKIIALGEEFAFENCILDSKMRVRLKPPSTREKLELSWAIIMVSQYYGTELSWRNGEGQDITFDDVVRFELKEPVDETAACGGTHRLFGLTWAYHLHLSRGRPKTALWQQVADHIEHHKKQARRFQNSDGSFSTEYVSAPGDVRNLDQRVSSTGHVFEWLALACTNEELVEQWMQDAASALSEMILNAKAAPIPGGSLYHAAHGLRMYRDRVFGPYDDHPPLMPRPGKD